jgi:hypothetical protein
MAVVWGKGTKNMKVPIRMGTLKFNVVRIFSLVFCLLLFSDVSKKGTIFFSQYFSWLDGRYTYPTVDLVKLSGGTIPSIQTEKIIGAVNPGRASHCGEKTHTRLSLHLTGLNPKYHKGYRDRGSTKNSVD